MDLYRFGGDEFALLDATKCPDQMGAVLKEAKNYLSKFDDNNVSFAYGVTVYDKYDNLHQTLMAADEIMYTYKQRGKSPGSRLD